MSTPSTEHKESRLKVYPSALKTVRQLGKNYVCVPMRHGQDNRIVEVIPSLAIHPLQFEDNPQHYTVANWVMEGITYYREGDWEIIYSTTMENNHFKVSQCEVRYKDETMRAFVNCFADGVSLDDYTLLDADEDDEETKLEALMYLDQAITEPPDFIKAGDFLAQFVQAANTIVQNTGSVSPRRKKSLVINGVAVPSIPSGRKQCEHCFKVAPVFRCVRCKSVHYCGQACQAADWKESHKKFCRPAVTSS